MKNRPMLVVLIEYANCYNNKYSVVSALKHLGIKKCILDFKDDIKPGKNFKRGKTWFCATC